MELQDVKEESPEEAAPKRKAEAEAGSKKRKPKKKKQEGEAVQPEAGAVTPGASSGDNPQVAGEGGVAKAAEQDGDDGGSCVVSCVLRNVFVMSMFIL